VRNIFNNLLKCIKILKKKGVISLTNKSLNSKNYSELVGIGVGIIIGSQLIERLGDSNIASILAGVLIVAGIFIKKKE